MPHRPSKASGFTLIELLVVIAVLGALSGIVIVAINPTRRIRETEDVQRIAGVKQIRDAMEGYYALHRSYPCASPTSGRAYYLYTNPSSSCPTQALTGEGFLKRMPAPPLGGVPYYWCGYYFYYYVYAGGQQYYILHCLESWTQAEVNALPRGWGDNQYAIYWYSWYNPAFAYVYSLSNQKMPVRP